MLLHTSQKCLRDTKERNEGPLDTGHDIREEELQDHDSKTQPQCSEDSHMHVVLRGER